MKILDEIKNQWELSDIEDKVAVIFAVLAIMILAWYFIADADAGHEDVAPSSKLIDIDYSSCDEREDYFACVFIAKKLENTPINCDNGKVQSSLGYMYSGRMVMQQIGYYQNRYTYMVFFQMKYLDENVSQYLTTSIQCWNDQVQKHSIHLTYFYDPKGETSE